MATDRHRTFHTTFDKNINSHISEICWFSEWTVHKLQYCKRLDVASVCLILMSILSLSLWCTGPTQARAASFTHNDTHTHTVGGTPLDKGSVRRRDLYLTKHNTHKRQTCMHSARYEPAIPASEGPQTLALDRSTTGTGLMSFLCSKDTATLRKLNYRG